MERALTDPYRQRPCDQPFPLHALVRQTDPVPIAALNALMATCEVNAPDDGGMTPLMLAASTVPKDPTDDRVARLLAGHADPLLANDKGNTALLFAARRGSLASVQALLPVSNLQHRNTMGWDLLAAAALNTDTPAMVATVLPFADPLRRYPMNHQESALMLALRDGPLDAVRSLAPVSDLTIVSTEGFTPLTLAARLSPLPKLLALLEQPVTISPCTQNGWWDALMLLHLNPYFNGHTLGGNPASLVPAMQALLQAGVSPNGINDEGRTFLDLLLNNTPIAWDVVQHLGDTMQASLALGALARIRENLTSNGRTQADLLRTRWIGQEQATLRTAMDATPPPHDGPAPRPGRARL